MHHKIDVCSQQNKLRQSQSLQKFQQQKPLQKLYRLYSPSNIIKDTIKYQTFKKKPQKTVIQLVFPNQNLLFIHPNKIIDKQQQHNIMEYNMLKKIIQRKKTCKTTVYNTRHININHIKPTTAPAKCYRSPQQTPKSVNSRVVKKNSMQTFYDFFNKKQKQLKFDPNISVSTTLYSRKSKIKTSKLNNCSKSSFNTTQKFRSSQFKENIQSNHQQKKSFMQSKEIQQDKLNIKKKIINQKFQEDKLLREKIYQNGVKLPKTQIYIDMEKKFNNYFRNY